MDPVHPVSVRIKPKAGGRLSAPVNAAMPIRGRFAPNMNQNQCNMGVSYEAIFARRSVACCAIQVPPQGNVRAKPSFGAVLSGFRRQRDGSYGLLRTKKVTLSHLGCSRPVDTAANQGRHPSVLMVRHALCDTSSALILAGYRPVETTTNTRNPQKSKEALDREIVIPNRKFAFDSTQRKTARA